MANLIVVKNSLDISRFQAAGYTEFRYLTQAEFNALAESEKATDTVFVITAESVGAERGIVRCLTGSITRAEMIAGKTILPARANQQLRILNYQLNVTGAYSGGAGTSLILQDTNGTPVVVTTALKAALTDGARIQSYGAAISNVTDGAGMTAPLTEGKGLAVKADAAWDAGTSIAYRIEYMYV